MSKFNVLMKYSWLRLLGTIQGKKQRKSSVVASLLVVLFGAGIVAIYGLQAWSMFKGLAPLGLSQICVFHASLITLCVLTILGVMRSAGKKKERYQDMLMSLPLKKSEIVLSKLISTYLLDLFFAFALLMPFVVLYFVFTQFSLATLLIAILMIFVLPLFSVGITNIASFVINRIFNKSKYASFYKSICSVFILLVVFALLMVKTIGYGTIDPANMNAYFNDRPLTNFLTKAILSQDLVSILVIVGLCIATFVLGLLLAIASYGKTETGYHSKSTEISFPKKHSLFGSLLKKEVNNYLTTPAFLSNTILAPLLILVLSIFISSIGIDGISQKLGVAISQQDLTGLICVIFMFSLSSGVISGSTVSLEGKNFWILKSSPIKENLLFLAKALLQVIFTSPMVVIGAIILAIFVPLNFVNFLIVLIVPLIFSLLLSFAGVFVNLCLPKLEFDDESKVVKQSLSTLVMMLGGMLLSVLPIIVYAYTTLTILQLSLIFGSLYLVLLLVFVILLFTVGKKLFRKL